MRATLLGLATMAGVSRPITRAVMLAGLANPEISEMLHDLYRAVFTQVVQDAREAQAAGDLAGSAPPEQIAEVLMRTCLGVAFSFMIMPSPAALLETLEPLLDTNIRSFTRQD